jgi:hypothetical protein
VREALHEKFSAEADLSGDCGAGIGGAGGVERG